MMPSLRDELFGRHYSLVHVIGYGLALLVLTVILSLVMGCGGGGDDELSFGELATAGEVIADPVRVPGR